MAKKKIAKLPALKMPKAAKPAKADAHMKMRGMIEKAASKALSKKAPPISAKSKGLTAFGKTSSKVPSFLK